MHNEGNQNGSGWSINTVTTDLSQLVEPSTSQDIFSLLTPQTSLNSLTSSNTALSSSLPSQFSLPTISYNELLRDLTRKFSQQQGSTSSSVVAAPPFNPLLLPSDFTHSLLSHTMNLSSQPGLSLSSTPFDTQSTHSAVSRAKKRSITEMRRTSLPPHSIADDVCAQLRMDVPSTSTAQPVSPLVDEPVMSKEDEEIQRELELEARRAAKEEFRRRPAPIIPDTYPRAPTPEDYGMLSENNYLPTHFFKGTKILLPNGIKKLVENLVTDDFIMCATVSTDLVMQTSIVKAVEKNRTLFRVYFEVGHNKDYMSMDASPEQPYFVIGKGWTSCDPQKTLEVYGLKAKELHEGDVCISLTTCEFESDETRAAIASVVGPRGAAQEAYQEANTYNIYQRIVNQRPNKSKKKRKKDRRRKREGRLSEPPPDLPSPKRSRRKRCRSVDIHWQTSSPLPPSLPPSLSHPPQLSKPFSPKNNKEYPNHIAFDFEI